MSSDEKAIPVNFTIATNRFSNLRATPVFEEYWRFAAERQKIYFRRHTQGVGPWTADPILAQFKFTNAYRAADRVSQYLISSVINAAGSDSSVEETFFRTLVFKIFNKIETWEVLVDQLGSVEWRNYRFADYDRILTAAMRNGGKIYSAAYIMPPVKIEGTDGVKHRGHLALIERMMRERVPDRCQSAKSLREIYEILLSYPSIGPFLGYQLTIDINYSELLRHSEAEFVVAGPGALDGISKCFAEVGDASPAGIIEFMADRQDLEFQRLGLQFDSLFGRPLQLIDCQNLFCEISKYSRVSHPEFPGASGRTRIKQTFREHGPLPPPQFPAKWNLDVSRVR